MFIKSLYNLDFCRKFSQKPQSEKKSVLVQTLKRSCISLEYKGKFYVELLEQIKSSSIGYKLATFGSRKMQGNIATATSKYF